MKKSELKKIIKECINEVKINKGTNLNEVKKFTPPRGESPTNPYGDNIACLATCLIAGYFWHICCLVCGCGGSDDAPGENQPL